MLREPKNDLFHFLNILESIGKIDLYLKDVDSPETFFTKNDQMVYNATLTLLANIGESIGKLSDQTNSYLKELDLNAIRGLRNRIVHDYAGLDSYIIYEIVQKNLIQIKNALVPTIKSYLKDEIIDLEELQVSRDSQFYRHIDFSVFD